MEPLTRKLYFDVDLGAFVRGTGQIRGRPTVSLSEGLGRLPFGQPIQLEVATVRRVNNRWMPVDYRDTWRPYLKIQRPNTKPERCKFVLRYDGEESSLLDLNLSSMQDVETALNALDGVTALGGVTVVPVPYVKAEGRNDAFHRPDLIESQCQPCDGRFYVRWNNPGGTAGIADARLDLEIALQDCWPICYPFIERVNEGAAATDQQGYIVSFLEQRLAYVPTWVDADASTATITRLIPGTAASAETQRLQVRPPVSMGELRVTVGENCVTDWFSVKASAHDVSAAMNKLGCHAETFHVIDADAQAWDITFSTMGSKAAMAVEAKLIHRSAKTGDLAWNDDLARQLLAASDYYQVEAEFSWTDSGTGRKLFSRRDKMLIDNVLS